MPSHRLLPLFAFLCLATVGTVCRAQKTAPAKKVLVIGDVSTGYQHDSLSHAMATIERLGRESGLYTAYLRTDSQLVTADKVWGAGRYAAPPAGSRGNNGKNLESFDAIVFLGVGEGNLSASQKRDLLAFVHDQGKGFVGIHTATDAFYTWPQYGEMIGAYFANHPWGVVTAPILVEEPGFPGFAQLAPEFSIRDEIYVFADKPYSRENVDVLARVDSSRMDLKVPGLDRPDHDFPVAWVKNYGKGRVFYSSFGHPDESWDDPRVQTMYLEAIKWALGLTAYIPHPHPLPAK